MQIVWKYITTVSKWNGPDLCYFIQCNDSLIVNISAETAVSITTKEIISMNTTESATSDATANVSMIQTTSTLETDSTLGVGAASCATQFFVWCLVALIVLVCWFANEAIVIK